MFITLFAKGVDQDSWNAWQVVEASSALSFANCLTGVLPDRLPGEGSLGECAEFRHKPCQSTFEKLKCLSYSNTHRTDCFEPKAGKHVSLPGDLGGLPIAWAACLETCDGTSLHTAHCAHSPWPSDARTQSSCTFTRTQVGDLHEVCERGIPAELGAALSHEMSVSFWEVKLIRADAQHSAENKWSFRQVFGLGRLGIRRGSLELVCQLKAFVRGGDSQQSG